MHVMLKDFFSPCKDLSDEEDIRPLHKLFQCLIILPICCFFFKWPIYSLNLSIFSFKLLDLIISFPAKYCQKTTLDIGAFR